MWQLNEAHFRTGELLITIHVSIWKHYLLCLVAVMKKRTHININGDKKMYAKLLLQCLQCHLL